MKLTCHSEVGKIESMFIKKVLSAFVDDDHISNNWKQLNYLQRPDLQEAVIEYDKFESVLLNYSSSISYLPPDDTVNMDSIYCRDAGISTNAGMIICKMGKDARNNEPHALKKACQKTGVNILGEISGSGTLEGGDVAWLDEHTLAVGHTYRTNEEGIRQLKEMVDPLNVEVVTVQLPHYKGPSDVFHLMSIFSPVDYDIAVVYSPLMPIGFRNFLIEKKYTLVEVSDDEFETMGCNVLALSPGVCLMVEGNNKTKTLLEKSGCKVILYDGNEISIKGGGGPTCLTRPIYRSI